MRLQHDSSSSPVRTSGLFPNRFSFKGSPFALPVGSPLQPSASALPYTPTFPSHSPLIPPLIPSQAPPSSDVKRRELWSRACFGSRTCCPTASRLEKKLSAEKKLSCRPSREFSARGPELSHSHLICLEQLLGLGGLAHSLVGTYFLGTY